MSRETRRKAYGRGQRAETLAAWWLRLKGYRILVRSFRVAAGEIDLIARRGRLIALIEVKARPSLEQARAAILPRQRECIARAAEVFLQRHPELAARRRSSCSVIRNWPGSTCASTWCCSCPDSCRATSPMPGIPKRLCPGRAVPRV